MPDKLISAYDSIIAGAVAALTFLGIGKLTIKRQLARLDGHDKMIADANNRLVELDRQITILKLQKLDEEKARMMVDSVHSKHNDMQYEFKAEMKEHRKEVNEKLESIEQLIRVLVSK